MNKISSFIYSIVKYWSANMLMVTGKNWEVNWPGFRYNPEEKSLMENLSKEVKKGEFILFLFLNTVVFIVMAALLIWFGFISILQQIYPNPQDTSAAVFLTLLGLVAVFMLTVGTPLSMGISAFMLKGRKKLSDESSFSAEEIRKLFFKVIKQFLRIGIALTVVSLIGSYVMIYYNIDLKKSKGFQIILYSLKGITLILSFFYYAQNLKSKKLKNS